MKRYAPRDWTDMSTPCRESTMTQRPITARGRATRERIVTAASELIRERGVAQTSLDDVIARAGVSKSQLYHYFEDRAALLRAVVDHNTEQVLGDLGRLDDSWKAIRAWLDSMVELQVERRGYGGCPIGTPVSQLGETDEPARRAPADSFTRWEAHLRAHAATGAHRAGPRRPGGVRRAAP